MRSAIFISESIVPLGDFDGKEYFAGIEYQDGEMEAIYFDDGRVAFSNGTAERHYYLQDHLGNNRVVFKDDGSGQAEVVQESHYYPFGMSMEGDWSQSNSVDPGNNYLYNGKELDQDFGLDWYHYGARFYDPTIARWNAIDPLAEKFNNLTPYHYVTNNPINIIDPNGIDTIYINRGELNTELSDAYTNVWNTYTSLVSNGVETILDLPEGQDQMYMYGDKEADALGHNILPKDSYKLKWDKLTRYPNWESTIRVTDFGVFLHKGGNMTWFGGCKGVCTKYETDNEKKHQWEGTPIFTSSTNNSQNTLDQIRQLYESHEENLSGGKFLLQTNQPSRGSKAVSIFLQNLFKPK